MRRALSHRRDVNLLPTGSDISSSTFPTLNKVLSFLMSSCQPRLSKHSRSHRHPFSQSAPLFCVIHFCSIYFLLSTVPDAPYALALLHVPSPPYVFCLTLVCRRLVLSSAPRIGQTNLPLPILLGACVHSLGENDACLLPAASAGGSCTSGVWELGEPSVKSQLDRRSDQERILIRTPLSEQNTTLSRTPPKFSRTPL